MRPQEPRPEGGSGLVTRVGGNWIPVAEAVRRAREANPGARTVRIAMPGSMSVEEHRRWRQLRDSHFFMVRNRGGTTGERWSCQRCSSFHIEKGVKVHDPIFHEFFTIGCVNRPWRGLVDALWGYTSITNNERLAAKMMRWAPELANPLLAARAHPFTLGRMVPPDPEGDVLAVAIGVLEPIDETKARQLETLINQRNLPAPFVL